MVGLEFFGTVLLKYLTVICMGKWRLGKPEHIFNGILEMKTYFFTEYQKQVKVVKRSSESSFLIAATDVQHKAPFRF